MIERLVELFTGLFTGKKKPRTITPSRKAALRRMLTKKKVGLQKLMSDNRTRLKFDHTAIQLRVDIVEAAFGKIDSDKYGWCKSCQEEIEIERLATFADVELCKKCGTGFRAEGLIEQHDRFAT